ncbi:hypothetical protein QYE76_040251 [Lolium multiflorum]|uniref:Uncharacterized protein n=1 Tax=Lolium multiflorum TaxID=4521 RepID=A0AAD8TD31_LOLMU|nr:hypothetical protein QYE76_040251 [Lolium multiflorum]
MFFSLWESLDVVDVIFHPYYNGIKLVYHVLFQKSRLCFFMSMFAASFMYCSESQGCAESHDRMCSLVTHPTGFIKGKSQGCAESHDRMCSLVTHPTGFIKGKNTGYQHLYDDLTIIEDTSHY